MAMIQVGIKMGVDLQKDLTKAAHEERRSFSDYCRIVLEDKIRERKSQKVEDQR